MIRINLLGEEVDKSGLHFLQLLAYIGSLIIALGACYLFQSGNNNDLSFLEKEKQSLDLRLSKLKKTTKEVEDLEEKKKLLKEKLMTIAMLKANKHGPVSVLDDLNLALPERAWFSEIQEKNNEVEVSGVALDNQTVATFMVELEKSRYFKDVDLGESIEYVKDNVKLRSFRIKASLVSSLELNQEDKEKAEAEAGKAGPEKKKTST